MNIIHAECTKNIIVKVKVTHPNEYGNILGEPFVAIMFYDIWKLRYKNKVPCLLI